MRFEPAKSSIEGLKATQEAMRREIADLQRVRNAPVPSLTASPGGGGYPTVFVAASNASAKSKSMADYVCDGTADDVEINAAVADLSIWPAGRLALSEGEFYLANPVVLADSVTLEGMGFGTMLIALGATLGLDMSVGYCVARDLQVWGPSSSGSIGIQTGSGDSYVTIENCQLGNCDTLIALSGTHERVVGCNLYGALSYSIDVTGNHNWIDQCRVSVDVRLQGWRNMVLGNQFMASSGVEITATGNLNALSHNFLAGGAGDVADSGTGTQYGGNFSNSGAW